MQGSPRSRLKLGGKVREVTQTEIDAWGKWQWTEAGSQSAELKVPIVDRWSQGWIAEKNWGAQKPERSKVDSGFRTQGAQT